MIVVPKLKVLFFFVLALLVAAGIGVISVKANNASAVPPFSQNWTNTGVLTVNDDWSGV